MALPPMFYSVYFHSNLTAHLDIREPSSFGGYYYQDEEKREKYILSYAKRKGYYPSRREAIERSIKLMNTRKKNIDKKIDSLTELLKD